MATATTADARPDSRTPARAWDKAGWRAYPRVQMPDYPDTAALSAVEAQLGRMPPLVTERRATSRDWALGLSLPLLALALGLVLR